MKTKLFFVALTLLALSILGPQLSSAFAQGTEFTYQGRLNDGANPASGSYDLRFIIYDSTNNPGTVITGPLTNSATGVSNGLFTTPLDFGSQFDGTPRWLEISVQKNGGGFTTLAPRQPILPVPYAIFANTAGNLSGTVSLGQLPGAVLTNYQSDASLNGTFTGNGNYLTNLNPQNLASGNVGAQLFFTNQFNFFNGGFNGYHSGDGNYLTNLNPQNFASGNVGAQLFFTNQFNFFNGGFNGYHSGDGHYLTNLDPQNLASGNVGAQLFFTNQFNFFNGGFNGYHNGDGGGLTNVPVNGISGGLNVNIAVLVPGGGSSILCFTNGILRDIK